MASSTANPTLPPGQTVKIHSLKSKPELNGTIAVVLPSSFNADAAGRLQQRTDTNQAASMPKTMTLKPECLEPITLAGDLLTDDAPPPEPMVCSKRPRVSLNHERSSALETLLGMKREDFFSQHWEQSPLVCRGGVYRGALEGLPNWESLLRTLNACEASSVLVLKDQTPTTEHPSLAAAYLDGCSIIVNHLERYHSGVRAMYQAPARSTACVCQHVSHSASCSRC